MKNICITLLFSVLFFGPVAAQMTAALAGPFPAYKGQHAGMKMPYLYHVPPNAVQTRAGTGHIGEKYPLIIDIHGIGERTSSFASIGAVTTADINKLYNNGIPPLLQTATSALAGKSYSVTGGPPELQNKQFLYMSPQCYGNYSYFYPTYGYNSIATAKLIFADILDTTRIYLVGLSFGGGAVWTWLQDNDINQQVAGAVAICPGYLEYVWNAVRSTPTINLKNVADWGGILIGAHATNDSTTDRNPSTKVGSYYSDRGMDSVLKYKGTTTVYFVRWTTGQHTIWPRIQNPANAVNTYPMSNGQNRGFPVPIQQLLLPYSTAGRRKL